MKKHLFNLILVAAFGAVLTACTSEEDRVINSVAKTSFAPAKSSTMSMYSRGTMLATNMNTLSRAGVFFEYIKVQDKENTTPEHMGTFASYYMNAPQKTDRGESVSQAEYEFVIQYIKNNPEKGSTECNLESYFMQNVGSSYNVYHTTDWNGASHQMTGGNQMDYLKINGIHMNDYNAHWGPRVLVLNNPVTGNGGPSYHDSYGDTDQQKHNKYRFYKITYNGVTSYYLGFDYATHKNSGNEDHPGDGIYNDWVVKLTPADGSPVTTEETTPATPTEPENPSVEPTTPVTPITVSNGEVEVNLSVNKTKENDDYIASKTSIHVRAITDVEMFIPVKAEYYCDADDMNIVLSNRLGNLKYNNTEDQTMVYNVNGHDVKLTVSYETEGIRITTDGINEDVINYLSTTYQDGITFEVWNYYKSDAINRNQLQELLSKSTIKFLDNAPEKYINAFGSLYDYEDGPVYSSIDSEGVWTPYKDANLTQVLDQMYWYRDTKSPKNYVLKTHVNPLDNKVSIDDSQKNNFAQAENEVYNNIFKRR